MLLLLCGDVAAHSGAARLLPSRVASRACAPLALRPPPPPPPPHPTPPHPPSGACVQQGLDDACVGLKAQLYPMKMQGRLELVLSCPVGFISVGGRLAFADGSPASAAFCDLQTEWAKNNYLQELYMKCRDYCERVVWWGGCKAGERSRLGQLIQGSRCCGHDGHRMPPPSPPHHPPTHPPNTTTRTPPTHPTTPTLTQARGKLATATVGSTSASSSWGGARPLSRCRLAGRPSPNATTPVAMASTMSATGAVPVSPGGGWTPPHGPCPGQVVAAQAAGSPAAEAGCRSQSARVLASVCMCPPPAGPPGGVMNQKERE